MVYHEFMQKLERIKAGLSRKYSEGINFDMLFNIVMILKHIKNSTQ